ncbi:MAG: MBL fold metallo-hydrolase [Rickettsiales bacterium]|jgi:glyoxylase-like metal-dependent hydrolase (beta-lactamase superfamily II)|nr:MBL fold metallo-hydrolase [Rickettsiales bacterium]
MNPKFELLQMNPKNTKSVLVSASGEAVVFDAWGLAGDWEELLADRGLNLRAIYSTHGHGDHISAAPALAQKLDIPWHLNYRDIDYVLSGNGLLEYFGLPQIPADCKQPVDLRAGEIEILPGIRAQVIETPGHSEGGLVFYLPALNLLIIGDTLFQETVGRYDLPGGDLQKLRQSIAKLYNMNFPDDATVIHGHGMDTTIGWLKKNNKFFKN